MAVLVLVLSQSARKQRQTDQATAQTLVLVLL